MSPTLRIVTDAIEPTPDQPLAGRVAVITGGSRGMGLSMAEAYAAAGADVVIASRKLDVCEQAAEKIVAATGRRAVAVACHVGRWDDLEALYERAYAEFPRSTCS